MDGRMDGKGYYGSLRVLAYIIHNTQYVHTYMHVDIGVR